MATENTTDLIPSLVDLECKSWTIYNILQTLYVAMPEDSRDGEVPSKCLISHVVDLASELATTIGDMEGQYRIAVRADK